MVPNHLFQLLSLTRWSRRSRASTPMRCAPKRPKVLEAIQTQKRGGGAAKFVRGPVSGRHGRRHRGRGLSQGPRTSPGSTTETYVALKLMIDNWRWAGVPFYLRTGKALARAPKSRSSFKQAPFALFRDTPVDGCRPTGS
jgi:glucose-6-phosphate 1-dehydrogenase